MIRTLVDRLQTIAQKWEHLLYLSGGKLNLKKCLWYMLRSWECWKKGRPVIQPMLPTDPVVQLETGNSEDMTVIRRSHLDESQRMLGVIMNLNGDFGDHIKYLKSKADTFAQRLLSPVFPPAMFGSSIDQRTFPMRYGLSAVALDEELLGQVQSKVVQSILKRCHIQSTIPTAIRYGPAEYGGLDIYDLRTEAGLEAIKFFRDAVYT